MHKVIAGHHGKALAKGLVPLARAGCAQVAEACCLPCERVEVLPSYQGAVLALC